MTSLRQRIQDLARAEDWAALLDLEPELRGDVDRWVDIGAPLLAIAARRLGHSGARRFLDEAVERGFWQPENFRGMLEEVFGADPDWTAVVAAMAANVPPPRLELVSLPELSLAHPLGFTQIAPERVGLLRDLLPPPQSSAWATATGLLQWVSLRWVHSGDFHVEWKDAVHVLERVGAGERFACVEYAIVLSQGLNAVGIPARTVRLFVENHHAGVGRAHQVTEAWIDDLGRWVVLDGQNGMYWALPDGTPLNAAEMRRMVRAGEPPPRVESLAGKRSAEWSQLWWGYFRTIQLAGCQVAPPPFSPVFQGAHVMTCDRLVGAPDGLHPDLLEIGIGIADAGGTPAVAPVTRHPHARGFELAYDGAPPSRVDIGGAAPVPEGAHGLTIATVTDFGAHGPRQLRFGANRARPA